MSKPLPFLLIGTACLIILIGLKMLISSFHTHKVDLFLDHWQSQGIPPNPKALDIAQTAALNAHSWFPIEQGANHFRIGKVYEWQAFHLPIGDSEANTARRQALDAYRTDTQLRPTWPYAWSHVALMKSQLVELDEEFTHAYQMAKQTGPWRRDTLFELSRIGIDAWPRLSPLQKRLVLETTVQAIITDRRNIRPLTEQLNNARLFATFCVYYRSQTDNLASMCS
ncbi:hypothetical protein [Nitrincola nitratireducens]|uniref:Uncharacterized protein n=1 Tax=Nitrincola nitratireducens TaxID=1229521 RepID=W9V1G3_9GAMM|nr:hypothetical protein [Nitrincola nitratireducens]EXJ10796.1 hypothetical protein D791_02161 [Nitrincola nitratireducens]